MFYVTSFYDIKIHDGWLHKILIVLFWKLHKRGPLAAVQQEQSIVSRYGKAIILSAQLKMSGLLEKNRDFYSLEHRT